MSRPRLLDAFCGAGGLTAGYQAAGFYVIGVDIAPQPNYVGDEFHQLDAMKVLTDWEPWEWAEVTGIDAIHASPPCPGYANVTKWRGCQDNHPKLIAPVREQLQAIGVPWVMENVRTKELHDPFVLCGSMFGLSVRRHRYFETSWPMFELVPSCQHEGLLPFMHKGERAYADAMGCDWMSSKEARQAVPPAYSEWIGTRLMAQLTKAAA